MIYPCGNVGVPHPHRSLMSSVCEFSLRKKETVSPITLKPNRKVFSSDPTIQKISVDSSLCYHILQYLLFVGLSIISWSAMSRKWAPRDTAGIKPRDTSSLSGFTLRWKEPVSFNNHPYIRDSQVA